MSKLPKKVAQRILKKLKWLASNFDSIIPEPLKGQFEGMYKLRIGDYRVMYTFDNEEKKLIIVHLVKHRREVYKTK